MTPPPLKPGWKMVKFGDIAQNVAVRVDPADAKSVRGRSSGILLLTVSGITTGYH